MTEVLGKERGSDASWQNKPKIKEHTERGQELISKKPQSGPELQCLSADTKTCSDFRDVCHVVFLNPFCNPHEKWNLLCFHKTCPKKCRRGHF